MPDSPIPSKVVALYSGGIDSYCMAAIMKPDVLLNVNLGGRYGDTETRRLKAPPGMEDRLVTVDFPLGQYELPENFIIPARNAILAMIAVNYGDTILLGSVAQSRGADKDKEFQARINHLFEHMFSPQPVWLPDGKHVWMELPVYHMTKTQLVMEAMIAGYRGEDIRDDTFSCYTPTPEGEECGQCKPCGRKWGALAANGIEPAVDARAAFWPYVEEVEQGDPNQRGPQFSAETIRAWNSPFHPFPTHPAP